ncbi:MAG: hypothetical protein KKD38_05900 [Candidatus Delongbacteria bacterium]|nr:hypothetical protein [Candidatus Delongbacteria bacterium]MCG2759795.1 hypothetical protein [Candidatus Delongbacteria bacterium]
MRIIKTVSSDRVPELMEFEGKRVEIIILPNFIDDLNEDKQTSILELRGTLSEKIDGMEFQNAVRKDWDMR